MLVFDFRNSDQRKKHYVLQKKKEIKICTYINNILYITIKAPRNIARNKI